MGAAKAVIKKRLTHTVPMTSCGFRAALRSKRRRAESLCLASTDSCEILGPAGLFVSDSRIEVAIEHIHYQIDTKNNDR